MARNLVSLVMRSLTPEVITKIAAALGLDHNDVQKALSAAVPALLASLASVAARPSGANEVWEMVKQHRSGALKNLGRTLEGSDYGRLVEKGSGMLASLLGASTFVELSGAIGKYAGLGRGASSSLMGILGPVVAATLKKQQEVSGLDPSGLAKLLVSQKEDIQAVLPSGLAEIFKETEILDDLDEYATKAAQSATTAAYRAVDKPTSFSWLGWAIPMIAVLAVAGYLLVPRATKTVENPATVATQPAAIAGLMVDGIDIGTSVTSTIDNVETTLEGITDKTTAQTALPVLQEAAGALDGMTTAVAKLSSEQKTAFTRHVSTALPRLDPLFDKILAIPGVAEITKPAIDGLRAKLDDLAKA